MKALGDEIYDKSTQGTRRLQLCRYLHSFSRCWLLPPKSAKSREILRKFELIAVQGHPRSLILVSIESAYATSYYSLIVTMDISLTIFDIHHVSKK